MPALGEETVPPDEAAMIARLVEQNLALLNVDERPVRRGQHPKHHGCVRAEFIVEPDLPAEFRHGLFASPRRYDALIRFSNGESRDDRRADAHGMAIKLFDVPGEKLLGEGTTHDFILLDHPIFFIRNVEDYVGLFDALLAARRSILPKLAFFLPRLIAEIGHVYVTYLRKKPHELDILLDTVGKKPKTPLQEYWSTTPYLLGPQVVRWSARPAMPLPTLPQMTKSPDLLRHALAAQLDAGEVSFDFMAQVQSDAEKMPIEDPTIRWDEKLSPPRKVATLRLPKQRPDGVPLMEFCEHLSFNPWRCLPEHRPLGGINRARKDIYDKVSRKRHELNGVPVGEPSLEEFLRLHEVGRV
ncbi:MAG: catalase family protein [Planctomycetes bacterium]|nr:catalase family protein [Planctomycetota bacterium]